MWPNEITFAAWQLVGAIVSDSPQVSQLMDHPFYVYFGNSLFITLVAVGVGLPVTSMAAYANSKLQRGRGARPEHGG
jgi:multiple sugar transport system permease protein